MLLVARIHMEMVTEISLLVCYTMLEVEEVGDSMIVNLPKSLWGVSSCVYLKSMVVEEGYVVQVPGRMAFGCD